MYINNFGLQFSDDRLTLLKVPEYYNGDLVIPSGVQTIGEFACFKCSNIRSISIPGSVKRIDRGAFSSCDQLKTIVIPDSVTEIYGNIFSSCVNLSDVTISGNIKVLKGSYSAIFTNNHSIQSIRITEGLIRLEKKAFWNMKSLSKIYLPSTILSISEDVICDCPNLSEIIVPTRQKEKFLQFNALDEYKFTIKEEPYSTLRPVTSATNSMVSQPQSSVAFSDGKSLLLYYAKLAHQNSNLNLEFSLYEDAEKLGSIEAAYWLGLSYINRDYDKGYFYMSKAAQENFKDAKQKLIDFQRMRK
jgi:hypothetical protein